MIEQQAGDVRRFAPSTGIIVAVLGLLGMSGLVIAGISGDAEQSGERIASVVVRGNARVPTGRILAQMRLREGSIYTPAASDEDLKRIHALGEFDNISIRPQREAAGLVLVVEVTERPVLDRLEFEGARNFKEKDLAEAIGVTAGSPVDPSKLFGGIRAIERKYREEGYFFVSVTLNEQELEKTRVARYVISEGPRVRVSKIVFSGNNSLGASELENKMETKPYFPIFHSGVYDEDQVDRDLGAVRTYYVEQGFLDVKLGRELEFSPDKTSLTIHVIIDEGPRYHVRSVSLEGVERFSRQLLMKQMALAPEAPYTADAVHHDVELIRDQYGEVGYIDVFIRPVLDFTDEPGEVDVTLKVEEHQPVRIGDIRIEGNTRTQEKVIRRELKFFPEEEVNTKLFDRAKRRLEGTGLYKPGTVQITTIPTAQPGVVDVLVRADETETNNFILGAGVSSNSGVVGNISLINRNFDISDWPKSGQEFWRGESFRGAGQLGQIVLEPGTQLQRYRLDFRDPHVFDTDLSFSSSLFYFDRDRLAANGSDVSYNEQRVGLNLGVGKELRENLQGFTNFRLESIDIRNIEAGAPSDVTDVKGTSGLTSVEVGLVHDTTDSQLFPSEGHRLMASVEQAGALGGDYTFTKFTVDGRQYWTMTKDVLDRKSVLSVHGRVGFIPGSDAPIFERFYAGGQGSIRGFQFRGVGPRKGDTFVGGDFLALAGSEYQFPIWEKTLSGVLFLDSGTVDQNISASTWRTSIGFGFRFTVPFFGPVPFSLDFGVPISKAPGDKTEFFSFSIGTSF